MLTSLRTRLAASGLILAALAASAHAQDAAAPAAPAAAPAAPAPVAPDTVLVTVGDAKITQADLEAAGADLGSQFAQLPPDQRRLATLAALIDIRALAAKGEAEKLADDPETARRIAFLRERALHNAYFEKHGIAAITDAEVRARYDQEVAAMKPVEEVHAKHILVPTKEEAEAVVKELDAGKDFDALAAEKSTGPTGPQGGDLGFFGPGQMVPAFETAAYALEPGTYTKEPVQTQFGWHVIKVLEKRPQQPPAFEQVADQVRQVVMREKYVDLVQAARAEEGVTYEDPALKAQVETMEKAMSGGGEDPEAVADEAEGEAAPVPAEGQPATAQ
ncbi:peptidylprolyl isomerase [Aureimonas flava]|uniref:Parvulin-like PPIase n=1 Tax=Aureimonas flava TaxID=2320271 RepID=A0A3A1WJM3_9HYPH|nr:peptidylprolyl isomerase [Aureimonas flava]RIX99224.1 peptidylprolyl isomerase [Aureimonas flava]